MYYDNKYLTFYTGESYIEYPPFFYIDFFRTKVNLKRNWRDSNELTFSIGLAGYCMTINVRWGYKERARTKREEERHQRTLEFLEGWGNE